APTSSCATGRCGSSPRRSSTPRRRTRPPSLGRRSAPSKGCAPATTGCRRISEVTARPRTRRGDGSRPAEVFADDPVRLPLVGLADVARETDLLRLRVRHRQRLPVADLVLPLLHQTRQTLDLRAVFRVRRQVTNLIGV